MVGGTLTAFLAALHYWFPKLTGRLYNETAARIGWLTISAGFFLTFTPQFLLGNAGMPRRYATYPAEYQPLHVTSTIGALILGAGMLVSLATFVAAIRRGRASGDDPWRSKSYEWRSPSPPPPENFAAPPAWTEGPYDYE
jgi:cytochrome c oxidase subunit 1